ncbi:3-oxoacyl-ACP synthase [Stieleria sp. JC731]|uniref:beta-ketoacyl-[acyl-carrier-protein] synthase family protein n=1 Tax=Pirellulaceae TaxID=2691357 RepID=UPI001E2FB99B|nr:beta-ketoacyl synthase N-terminal-like domain-containing protein [Stieleria sp. JC731]MCC9602794.1 3-oxoacyl-ACP synthase [Stieleria sp. JC731]
MTRQPAVITGIGIVSAIGIGQQTFFDGLLEGRSGVRSLADRTDEEAKPGPDDPQDGVWIGAPVVDFDAKQFVRPRKALKVMCREIQTAFASAQLAVEHAGLGDQIPASESGLISPDRLGTVYGGEIYFNPPTELMESIRRCVDSDGQIQAGQFGDAARKEVVPLWMLKYLPNMPACQVGISINSQGPNNSLVLGDVSGPAALLEGCSYLDRGIADINVVGATGTRVGSMRMTYTGDLPIVERGENSVANASRPYDPNCTGVVGGEGAASLVIETAEHAQRRGATVLARILGIASRFAPTQAMKQCQRGNSVDQSESRQASSAIKLAIEAALEQAGVAAKDIALVVSHAMGDRQVDSGEAMALNDCQIDAPVLPIIASIGHTGAAAGMMEIATGALVIANGKIPAALHADQLKDANLVDHTRDFDSGCVLCVTHTTEGSAVAVVLGK